MKKHVLFALVFALVLSLPASAHSGRTDANGGHHDSSNQSGLGSYHYHHGYPAHLHPGGVCPYAGGQTGVSSTAGAAASAAAEPEPEPETDRFTEGYSYGYNDAKAEFDDGVTQAVLDEKVALLRQEHQSDLRQQLELQEEDLSARHLLLGAGICAVLCLFIGLRARRSAQKGWDAASAELARSRTALAAARKECETASSANRSLQSQLTALRRQCSDLQTRLKSQIDQNRRLQEQIDRLMNPEPAEASSPPPKSDTQSFAPKTFDRWMEATHKPPAQQRRIQRALSEPLEVAGYQDFVYKIHNRKDGKAYGTTLHSCTCYDFRHNTAGQAPCKHIYFLAKHLGFPIESYLD